MKHIFSLLLFFAIACQTQNLLNNPEFSDLWHGLPLDWNTILSNSPESVEVLPQAGPNGENALRLNLKNIVAFGQSGISLVAGESYKLGAFVRTKDFTCSRGGVVISNYNWENETKSAPFPQNTAGKWVKIENDVICLAQSPNEYRFGSSKYGFQIFATDANGRIEIAAPYLLPTSPRAFKGSAPSRSFNTRKDIFPVSPLLDQIPSQNAVIEFYCPHYETGDVTAWALHSAGAQKGRLVDHRCKLTFPQMIPGHHVLSVSLTDSATGKTLVTSDYFITVIPAFTPTPARRLNNLVGELFNQPAKDGEISFALADAKWLFIQLDSGMGTLDGQPLRLESYKGKQETMVHASVGAHRLVLANTRGTFILRTIPEIFLHPFRVDDSAEYANSFCSYNFLKKYMSPAVNMYNFNSTWTGHYRKSIGGLNELRKTSRATIGSGGMAAKKWDDPIAVRREIETDGNTYFLGGRTLDELNSRAHVSRLWAVADGLWASRRMPERIYTWLEHGGRMCAPQYHLNLIAAQANASQSQGKFLVECYIVTYDTPEHQMKDCDMLRTYVGETKAFYPDYPRRLIVVSGGYQIPGNGITNPCYPMADPKCSQDMLFNTCANAPELDGLYGIGMYSFLSSDEENARWYGALFRHYAIEGKTSLLSKDRGFNFNPRHIKNCDFADGMDGWTATGAVKTTTLTGYGKYQGRSWRKAAAPGVGDTAAILAENAAVAQTAVNLTPGNLYSITYIAGDKNAYDDKKPCTNGDALVKLELSNADIVDTQSFDYYTKGKAYISRKVIFRPRARMLDLAFTALPSKDNTKRDVILNYIALRPYFPDEYAQK